MSDKVHITVTEGPLKGKIFSFEEHDTFLFGRLDECHFHLADDSLVSRRHFLVEEQSGDREAVVMEGILLWGKAGGAAERPPDPGSSESRSVARPFKKSQPFSK